MVKLYQQIIELLIKPTLPRIMDVPCKPHLRGNKYHSILNGDQGKPFMTQVNLQEGKEKPKDAGAGDHP